MPAPIRIVLTEEEDRTLLELRVATCVPQRTRDRAHILRLNAQGWNTPAIAEIFECHEHTVRATIRRWQASLELEERTYNSLQLAQKLASERCVKLSPDRLRHLLQKRALGGNARGTVIEPNKILSTNYSNKLS